MNFETLTTEGGKSAVLLFILLWLSILALVMHLTHHDPQETGRTLMTNAFTSVFTALIAKLTK